MNIKRAKQEIKDAVQAYLMKVNMENIRFRQSIRDRSF